MKLVFIMSAYLSLKNINSTFCRATSVSVNTSVYKAFQYVPILFLEFIFTQIKFNNLWCGN